MSEFVHKPGSFSLFKNNKGDNPSRPDYTGVGKDLDGNDIEVAALLKGEAGKRFMSCTFKVKGVRQDRPVGDNGGRPLPTRTPAPDNGGDAALKENK